MVERLTHHHVHAQRLGAGERIGGPHAEERDIHEHVGPIAERGQPAHALHRQFDVTRPLRQRHVQGAHGARTDHAVGLEAVPALKALEAVHEGAPQLGHGAARVRGCRRGQVAEGTQARLQLRHAGPGRAGGHFAAARHGRHERRFAGGGQGAVGRERGARPFVVHDGRLERVERGGESGVARLPQARHYVEGLGGHVVAPQHRGGIDPAEMHGLHHARGAHRHGEIEEGALPARHRAGLQARPLLAQHRGVIVGGVQAVITGRGERRHGAAEHGDRARPVEPHQAVGLGLVGRLQRRRYVGNRAPPKARVLRRHQHLINGGGHVGIERGNGRRTRRHRRRTAGRRRGDRSAAATRRRAHESDDHQNAREGGYRHGADDRSPTPRALFLETA